MKKVNFKFLGSLSLGFMGFYTVFANSLAATGALPPPTNISMGAEQTSEGLSPPTHLYGEGGEDLRRSSPSDKSADDRDKSLTLSRLIDESSWGDDEFIGGALPPPTNDHMRRAETPRALSHRAPARAPQLRDTQTYKKLQHPPLQPVPRHWTDHLPSVGDKEHYALYES